jgi:hypothetical protein
MHPHQMPQYLTDWATTFTSDRTLSFCFDSLRETPKPFKAGLPQGSPASQILFLIYANTIMNLTIPMNDHLESECTYIDDISLVISKALPAILWAFQYGGIIHQLCFIHFKSHIILLHDG